MVDFDDDGVITYVEVVNELADNLIEIIEASGRTVEDKVAELWEENRMELETLWSEYNAWQLDQEGLGETSLSPDLVQYLRDSFDAFDVDKNGTLNNEEFWQILTTVLGLTEGDRAMMQVLFVLFHLHPNCVWDFTWHNFLFCARCDRTSGTTTTTGIYRGRRHWMSSTKSSNLKLTIKGIIGWVLPQLSTDYACAYAL